ncbi:MAG: hypothetical protein ACYTEL_25530 [Planctomycetota bacterium]
MSILLSGYYPEGIVFTADKNACIEYETPQGEKRRYVESTATKVLAWPYSRAIVGFVGLGRLADYDMDEWMRVFIAGTRDFGNVDELAIELREQIQSDFNKDYRSITDISKCHLIIHLGGFAVRGAYATPVLYHIWNHGDIKPDGSYPEAKRNFELREGIEAAFKGWPMPEDYPGRVRKRLESMVKEKRFLWFNNGANFTAFNIFKAAIWNALSVVQDEGFAPRFPGLGQRVAYCKMAVDVFGSFFTYHYGPDERVVGGGVDAAYVPWPEQDVP